MRCLLEVLQEYSLEDEVSHPDTLNYLQEFVSVNELENVKVKIVFMTNMIVSSKHCRDWKQIKTK